MSVFPPEAPPLSKLTFGIQARPAPAGVEFAYEKEFRGHDGSLRLPDFTIEDAATGETYIWEHLGMLSNPQYARAWERKQAWYAASGVERGGGDVATLIVTTDDERGGINSPGR